MVTVFFHFYVVNVLYVPYCTCDSFFSRVKVFSGLIIRKCLVSVINVVITVVCYQCATLKILRDTLVLI